MRLKKFRISFTQILFLIAIGFIGIRFWQDYKNSKPIVEPKEARLRTITELATVDCYFNNVAKYEEKDAEGMLFWTKDKQFWIEYSGVVRLGVDASLIEMSVSKNKVKITIPNAKVLDSWVDEASLTEDSFLFKDNTAKIDADDQVLALAKAQEDMEVVAAADTTLLANAQQRTQTLLEDYVENIGNAAGIDYEIEWVFLEEETSEEKGE